MAEVPWGLCAQICPDIPACPGDQDTLLLPSPSSPQDSGIGPLHPQGCLPWIWHPLGTPHSLMDLLAFDNYFFPFSPPEKLKQHKIIFVVGKSVSRSCHWWGQPRPFLCTSRLGRQAWRLRLGYSQALWDGHGSSLAPRGHMGYAGTRRAPLARQRCLVTVNHWGLM